MNLDKYHTFLQLNPPIPSDVDTNYFNIFCLGGSTTEFRDSRGRDWPGLTQKLIREKYNIDSIRFYNLGKQWYTTQHTLINYIQNLRKFKPDVIIVMHNINDLLINADFSRFSNGNFREDYGHFLGPEALMIKYGSLAEFIFNNLKLLWYGPEPVDIKTDKFPGLVSFRNNLKTLTELARNSDTKIIFMTQPNIYKQKMNSEELQSLNMLNREAIGDGIRWTYETALSGIKKYNDTIRELSNELNVPLVDLEKVVPKSLDYFYDDVHYTDKTYDLISSYLSDELLKVIRRM
jgi:lysophospholipase L1-like esterase